MSIGIDHIGPMTISAQKNAAARLRTISVRSCVTNIGSMHSERAEKRRR